MEIIKPSIDSTKGIIIGSKKFILSETLKPTTSPPITNEDMKTGSRINIIFLFIGYFFALVANSPSA